MRSEPMLRPLLTYDPIDTLKPVAPAVWIVDGPLIRFEWLGLRLPIATRMAVVRLREGGGLWVHSPVPLVPGLKAQVDALSPVRHLVAPNTLHYAALPEWQRTYPAAVSHGAPAWQSVPGGTTA